MKVVSERFISVAIDCISASLSPRPSKNTAREFPSRGREEKTSHCAIANRRACPLTKVAPRIVFEARDFDERPDAPASQNVPEGTQLRFEKVFLQERLWKSAKKWMRGKPFIGSGLWVSADIPAANVVKWPR
jgi:hypothetical protein